MFEHETLDLVRTYLSNVERAFRNGDIPGAQALVSHVSDMLHVDAQPTFPSSVRIEYAADRDTGIRRQHMPNEDAVFASTGITAASGETYGLFIVADGMGGHYGGQEASQLAIETIVDTLLLALQDEGLQQDALASTLRNAVKLANHAIYRRSQSLGLADQHHRMGTTVTVALTVGRHAYIANVGDSRAYLYRAGSSMRVLTRDHSVVAALVATGAITPEEVYTHPERNVITRNLGEGPDVEVDVFYEQLYDQDTLLLCSDGLWELVRDEGVKAIIKPPWFSPQEKVAHAIYDAREEGGFDNIGVVVAQFFLDACTGETVTLPQAPSTVAAG